MENNNLNDGKNEQLTVDSSTPIGGVNKKCKKVTWFNVLSITAIVIFTFVTMIEIISIKSSVGVAKAQIWEYKTVKCTPAKGNDRTGAGAANISIINLPEYELNNLGAEGWELVNSYLEMETAYPNFGNEEYVTGIQPNVRPQCVVLLFKRPVSKK